MDRRDPRGFGPWDQLCELAGLPAPEPSAPFTGHPLVKILAHCYETQRHIPTRDQLFAYRRELGIPVSLEERGSITEIKQLFIAERSCRGLLTPPDGPLPGDELSQGGVREAPGGC